ncbi:MAG: hypothetical protein JNK99_11725 [Candidatus Accumulibacter sp.]|uniref:hypothetical protein n=1 Tax=Accumulibacter sp. TaxID=2053492 RepID=UPI001A59734A|nr:hypothetical protein [Accumulibacter sp.]MBL8395395.1 hypothetical protein [Accumulibacter sp.]
MQESGSPAELSLAQRESSGAAMESFIGGRQRCLGAMQFFIKTMHRFVCVRQASVGAMEFSVKRINRFVCARQACTRSSASRVQGMRQSIHGMVRVNKLLGIWRGL